MGKVVSIDDAHSRTLPKVRRVLFLDDNWNRHNHFILHQPHGRCEVSQVWTYSQAVAKMSQWEYHTVHLDHDLHDLHSGACEDDDGRPLNGTDLARWMADELDYRPQVVLHSWNPQGALAMERILVGAGFPVRVEAYPL